MCEPDKSPNIVFVFADQMSANHMRPDGNEDVITPTMDRMAEEGVMCTQHISNCPICSPNRATMLTGTYATTHRLLF
ncbi:MAG: sulfatase-like hydrolase/transferase, partial [Planctomycetes bacterium]|nr:sulfatase-like hydrolase/transferase [Planctomycetota bacterium]